MKTTRFCILNYTSLLYRIKFYLIFFILFFNLNQLSNCTTVTLGIDWGEEYVEASIAFRGHRPDILLTGTGSRKFENAVYLLGDTRLFDKEASSFALKDPSKTLQKSAHLLGIPFTSNSKWTRMSTLKASDVVQTLKKNNVSFNWDYTPYEFGVSKDGQLHLKVLKDSMLGLEEATAHFFNHLKNVALDKLVSVKAIDSHDSKVEMMAVISIPCNYTQNQRKALVFAAESAGLKVVDLVHGITAAAWLNTLEMAPGTKKILFYDLGSSGANVGVVEARVPSPKSKDFPQIRTLSCVTYPGIGGRQHDLLLAEYLRDKFESDNNVKLMPANPRSLQKLLRSVNKAKMKLSLSETASVEVDNLVKNKHLNFKLTRSDYDKLLAPVLQKLSEPVTMALNQANLKLSELDSVEVLGGAWRVPSVTVKLSESVKPLQLGFHLNAEESIAMGCGYLAAAHNPFFRMKKIELHDNAVFEYVLHVKGQDLDKRVTLYKPADRINHSKVVKVNTTNNFNLSIYEKYSSENKSDQGPGKLDKLAKLAKYSKSDLSDSSGSDVKILDYKVTGVDDMLVSQKNDRMAQVSLTFKTENGVIRLSKVSAKPVKKYANKKLNKTKYDPTTSEHTFSNLEDLKNKGLEQASEDLNGSVTTESQELDESDSSTDKINAEESLTHEDGSDTAGASGDHGSSSADTLGKSSTEDATVKGDASSNSTSTDESTTAATTSKPSDHQGTEHEDKHLQSEHDTEAVPSEDQKKKDTEKKVDGSEKSADKESTTPGDKQIADEGTAKKSTDKESNPENDKSNDKEGSDKTSKESLKDKLMNKLNEDQVDLHFVDNTVELYDNDKLKETMKNIETLVNRDKLALERSDLKNRLESLLYKYKTVLKSDDFKAACKPNEQQLLSEKVKSLLDWFDEHSYKATLETFKSHLEELNDLGTPIYKRMDSNVNRESLIKSADTEFAELQDKLNQLLSEKPYLNESTATLELFKNNVSWWEQIKLDQAKLPLFEEGLFDHTSVKSKLDLNRMLLKNLEQTQPPQDPNKGSETSDAGKETSKDAQTKDSGKDATTGEGGHTATEQTPKDASSGEPVKDDAATAASDTLKHAEPEGSKHETGPATPEEAKDTKPSDKEPISGEPKKGPVDPNAPKDESQHSEL